MKTTIIDITGERFGKLTVIRRAETRNGHVHWLCACDCGKETEVYGSNLRRGITKSCGCLIPQAIRERCMKHGLCDSPLYGVWGSMIQRCSNQKRKSYSDYGGRGISVCEEWRVSFQSFYDWSIKNGYKKGLSLDRIDNDGNYSPENCRWATLVEQRENRSDNHMLTFGNETKILSVWAKEYKMQPHTLLRRVRLGWDIERALLTPVRAAQQGV